MGRESAVLGRADPTCVVVDCYSTARGAACGAGVERSGAEVYGVRAAVFLVRLTWSDGNRRVGEWTGIGGVGVTCGPTVFALRGTTE
jgi:hypothetical protein